MKEITNGVDQDDEGRQIRGWKLFFLLPRLLLFRQHRWWQLGEEKFGGAVQNVHWCMWVQLFIDSEACEAGSSLASRRRRRNCSDTIDGRAERALNLVLLRHALDGEPVA